MYVAGIVEREEWSKDKRLSEKGKGKRGEGGEKARPQAEWDGVNTYDTFHIMSIKFHILITFILHASIIQHFITNFI